MQGRNPRKSNHYLLLCCVGALLSGCVSSTEHSTLQGEFDILAADKVAVESSCEEKIAGLQGRIEELEEGTVILNSDKQELSARVEGLAGENFDLIKKNRLNDEAVKNLQDMARRFRQALENKEIQIRQFEDELKIEVLEHLMFASGSVALSAQGTKILEKIVPLLKESSENREILVIGHADELPPGPKLAEKYPSNWELSAARAAAIVHVLTWRFGLNPADMMIQGVAHYRPSGSREALSPEERRKNNRIVEIILKPRLSAVVEGLAK